jgi:hypothetical protein
MRLLAATSAAVAALAAAAFAYAADAPGTGVPVARLAGCDLTGSNRSAVFYGRMDGIPGAAAMSMRFTLLEKLGRGPWTRVDVPELRQWRRAAPGVKTFGYRQTVDKLRSGAAYRARIAYRWSTAGGVAVAGASKSTGVCRAGLPELTIGGLGVKAGPTADTRVYRVTVSNQGRSDADDVEVRLRVDHALLDAVTIDELEAGESHTLSFIGPACKRGVRVEVDPDNSVGERREADNSQLFACP